MTVRSSRRAGDRPAEPGPMKAFRTMDLPLADQEVTVLIGGETFRLEGRPAVVVMAVVRDAELVSGTQVGEVYVQFAHAKANVKVGLSRPPLRFGQ